MQQPGGDAIAAYGLGNFYFDKKRHEDAIAAWEQSREIVNWFSRQLPILPPLQTSDYRDMLASIVPKVPPYFRETFLRIGHEKINEAMVMQQGCRFIEDTMLQTILSERTSLQCYPKNWPLNWKSNRTKRKKNASIRTTLSSDGNTDSSLHEQREPPT